MEKTMNLWYHLLKDGTKTYGGYYKFSRKHNGIKEFYLCDYWFNENIDNNFKRFSLDFYPCECKCIDDYDTKLSFKIYLDNLDDVMKFLGSYGINTTLGVF